MQHKDFFIQLSGYSIIVALILSGLHYIFPALRTYQDLSWLSCLLFIGITLFAYFGGIWSIQSPNKNLFTLLIFMFIGSKMMLSVILIMGYYRFASPNSQLFILPFFIVYLLYTIFELYLLIKISNTD